MYHPDDYTTVNVHKETVLNQKKGKNLQAIQVPQEMIALPDSVGWVPFIN